MQISPLIRNDRGAGDQKHTNQKCRHTRSKPSYVFLAIYLYIAFKSLFLDAVCALLHHLHSYRPLLLIFSDTYMYKRYWQQVVSQNRFSQHRPHSINHGWNAVVQDQEAKQTQDLSYLSLIHSFRPISNWLSARQPTKKFGVSRD